METSATEEQYNREHVLAAGDPTSNWAPWKGDSGPPHSTSTLIVDAKAPAEGGRIFNSLQGAIARILQEMDGVSPPSRRVIHIRAGFYTGPVFLPACLPPLAITGDGTEHTVLAARIDAQMSGSEYHQRFGANAAALHTKQREEHARIAAREAIGTHNTGVLRVACNDLSISGLTIRNDYACDRVAAAPDGAEPNAEGRFSNGQHQAVALHVMGADRVHLSRLNLSSFQDTLYLQTSSPGAPARVYLANCAIEGDVDFIFGGATAFFESCEIRARGLRSAPVWLTAPSTSISTRFGFVFKSCRLTHDGHETGRAAGCFLGRQWFEGIRASPYGRPTDSGYRVILSDANALAADGGTISHSTLEAVGKCAFIDCQIGPHINYQKPWDSWNGPGWSPRFRPVQGSASEFLSHLGPWLAEQGYNTDQIARDERWLIFEPSAD